MNFREKKRKNTPSYQKPIDKPLLLIEDSRSISNIIESHIHEKWGCPVHKAGSYAEAIKQLKAHRTEYFLAICDLNLPDAPNGEIMDLIKRTGLPAIIITGSVEKGHKQKSDYNRIFDFILKSQPNSVGYLIEQVGRFYYNQYTTLLIVDDSKLSREMLSQVLSDQNFKVLTADSGESALEVIKKHPEIKLVVSDYVMPAMNGVELTVALRKKHNKSKLAIIGISSDNEARLGLEFIRNGANDFLTKPFLIEELSIRINQNLDTMKYIEVIENIANRDYLTNLYNRRYFYDEGYGLLKNAMKCDEPFCTAIFDIDFFKKINDSHGHDVGDKVLEQFAQLLKQYFSNDLIARIGGEEFVAIIKAPAPEARQQLEKFREALSNTRFEYEDNLIPVTTSIGFNSIKEASLDRMLKIADDYLYQAKESGRNKVMGAE
ncbi:diguanylate cyclase [Paraneptunicella aestuarii]|uniref:GGDEF domain-containing response regulator n=1 Tax=Paraneptunicella aestuarii TaxID=2831148 RepID=UPI001E597E6D|nr:diguanylate cyclase [Paraneptunicella aestuarii]UAA38176.1 diguanylate cyclase [Paraneptunicella aestuarii]